MGLTAEDIETRERVNLTFKTSMKCRTLQLLLCILDQYSRFSAHVLPIPPPFRRIHLKRRERNSVKNPGKLVDGG